MHCGLCSMDRRDTLLLNASSYSWCIHFYLSYNKIAVFLSKKKKIEVDMKDGHKPNKEGAVGNFTYVLKDRPLVTLSISFFVLLSLSLSLSLNFSRVSLSNPCCYEISTSLIFLHWYDFGYIFSTFFFSFFFGSDLLCVLINKIFFYIYIFVLLDWVSWL